MDVVIFNSEKEGSLVLTSNDEGRPVLRIRGVPGVEDGDYAPSDLVGDPKYPTYAASLVYSWALERCRSDNGIAAAQAYLRQWPDGPQAEPEDIRKARVEHDALMQAAKELHPDVSPVDQLTPEQLRDHIHRMVESLAEVESDSAAAYVLRIRIGTATTLLYGFYHRASSGRRV